MYEVIRYVHIEGDRTEVRDPFFVFFFPIPGKTVADLIQNRLKSDGLDINMCHSQGYDNAVNMVGIHGGISKKKKIKKINPKFLFVLCKLFPKSQWGTFVWEHFFKCDILRNLEGNYFFSQPQLTDGRC